MTRVVEKLVEVEVTRVVEKPVEVVVTRLVSETGEEVVLPVPDSSNVARFGFISTSDGRDSALNAIDNDLDTLWLSGIHPAQWIQVAFDRLHLIDRVELVVAQTPAGETTHQIWGSGAADTFTKIHELQTYTSDGQTLTVPFDPPMTLDRVMILTTKSPSWVAWREVRVFGIPAPQPLVDWEPAAWIELNLGDHLEKPVQITNAGDGSGRLFVVEQGGMIKIISNGDLLPTPFLDISDRVACCHEQGLLSVAFPPDYAEKEYFYINYTNTRGNTVIARYRLTSDPNLADPQSAEIIMGIAQPHYVHNGGHMAFGPRDGYLYIGMGDGGPAGGADNRSQHTGTLHGKMLRIDVESGDFPYTIPEDNPFVETAGYRDEIWALGLRNPWGFAFDRQTGDLFIGDVGEISFEEINYQPAPSKGGENYGWAVLEGNLCLDTYDCDTTGLTQPIAGYARSEGCAIIGGPVYRGSQFIPMQGTYFYADFCQGYI